MRKIIGTLWIIAITLTASGCATTGKRTLFSDVPIALVSIVSNYDINWKGEEPTMQSKASDMFRQIRHTDEDWVIITKADSLIDEAGDIIRSTLEKSPHINLVPGEKVFNSRSYNEARLDSLQVREQMVAPAGYRLVYNRDNKFYPAFARETGIERTLFITLDLTKEMYSGIGKNGNCRANVDLNVLLKDERGKNLFSKTYNVSSRDQIKVTAGAYSQEELLELMRSAISDACLVFLNDLGL